MGISAPAVGWVLPIFAPVPHQGTDPIPAVSPSSATLMAKHKTNSTCPHLQPVSCGEKGSGARGTPGGWKFPGQRALLNPITTSWAVLPRNRLMEHMELAGRHRWSTPRFPGVYKGMKGVHMFTERDHGRNERHCFSKGFLGCKSPPPPCGFPDEGPALIC